MDTGGLLHRCQLNRGNLQEFFNLKNPIKNVIITQDIIMNVNFVSVLLSNTDTKLTFIIIYGYN